jgi:hypothetical protein
MADRLGDEQGEPPVHSFDLNLQVGDVVRSSTDGTASRWVRWRQPLAAALLVLLVAGVIVMALVATP